MRKAPIKLRDLRRRIYVKAKAEPEWPFWGLYVHVCKLETLREAYALAKRNSGVPTSPTSRAGRVPVLGGGHGLGHAAGAAWRLSNTMDTAFCLEALTEACD